MSDKLVCPYCKKDLAGAVKVMGCYESDLMVMHLRIHYHETIRQLMIMIRANALHEDLESMVDTLDEMESSIANWGSN